MQKSGKKEKPKNIIHAIERAASIVDILALHPQGLSLAELAEKVNLPKGTAHRILSSLAYFDYIRQDSRTRFYFLGFKFVELGNLILRNIELRNEAAQPLALLSAKVMETVHLVIQDDNKALYIDKTDSHARDSGLQMVSRVGKRIPMHCSAVGKVLLAHLKETEANSIIETEGLLPRTGRTINDKSKLRENLKSIRVQGYGIDDEENEEGIRCVAAPIRNGSGEVVAAISVSAPANRMPVERIHETVKYLVVETAREISGKLGYRLHG